MEKGKEEIAINNIKDVLTVGEIESLISLSKFEYAKLKEVYLERDQVIKNSIKKLSKLSERTASMPDVLKQKITKGVVRRINSDFDRELEEPLGRHKHIVDFINKFQCPTEMYSYLNEPVNQLKKRLV